MIGCSSLLACVLAASVALQAGAPLAAQEAGMQEMHHAATVASTTLTVTGVDGKQIVLTAAELAAMPHKTVTVYNVHAKVNEVYSGVELSDLLAKVGAPQGEAVRGSKMYLLYVIATGTDNYSVLYSLAETDPANHVGDVMVADAQDGKPLTTDGAFKLISTEEKRPARWVRNLTAITVRSAQ
jgi:hypothetical protein